jgi:hypothetical protein
MMRQSETMRAVSRLLLNHPIVCLLAALAAAVVLGVLGPLRVVHAADVTVQGESFNRPTSGTNLITGAGYSGGAALKFIDNVAASQTVNCSAPCDVVLMASGGQSGGQASFSVNGSTPQALTSTTTTAYTFHLPTGATTISVRAEGTGTGHNAILDVATFSASDGGTDTTPPDTTLSPPSVIGTTASFTFSSNEPSSFQCKLVGWDLIRINPCPSPKAYTGLTVGTTYTFKVWATDAAGNIDPTPATFTFTPSDGTTPPPPTGGEVHLVGAGDIADRGNADEATGNLIEGIPSARVFTAGDNAYPNGTDFDFNTKYDPAWGLFANRTYPTPGNHDYNTAGVAGYKKYFDPRTPATVTMNPTYYTYTYGAWQIYALDSNLMGTAMTDQVNWLRGNMQSNGATCELAYYHHATVSTGEHGSQARTRAIFDVFDAQGGDVILAGHDHNYERFQTINSSGQFSANGVRQIVVGTGGTGLRPFPGSKLSTTEARNADTQGILDLTLRPTDYSGLFVPAPGGGNFTDSFSGTCGI